MAGSRVRLQHLESCQMDSFRRSLPRSRFLEASELPADLLRVIDLLNGAIGGEAWLDRTIDPCPYQFP